MSNRKEYEMLFKLNAQLGGSYNSTFKAAQKELTSMQKEIQNLSKTQSDISSFQKQQSAVEATGKKLAILQQQYDNIQKEMSETGISSSELQNKLLSKQLQIDKTSASLDHQKASLNQLDTALREAGVDTAKLSDENTRLGTQMDALKKKQEDVADEANNYGNSASQAFGAVGEAIAAAGVAVALKEIYEAFAACADASIAFESAMTGVAKTTSFTDAEFAAMSSEIKAMSTEIPATTDELALIAETAGQLGIQKDSLLDFTEIMAMLGTATNMTADEAATMLAQFASITGMDPANYSNLASTIVDLGNNFATTERNIAAMSQTIAAAGAISGMSEADITAIAAAVTSLGISSENGGTQMTKLISDINSAVSSSEGLSGWASAAQMSAADFAAAWGEDAAGALDLFIHGLNETYESGGDVYGVLSDLGITETRMVTAITSMAKSGTRLTETLDVANRAWGENNALMTEAEKRYATTASLQTMAQSAYNNLTVAVGDNFTPAMQKLYAIETEVFKGLTAFVEQNPALIKAVAAFIAVLGIVVAALTAYALIAKVAATASALLTAAIPGLNIIMGVTVAIAAATAGIVALASASDEAVPSVYELTEAARGMSETMDEATATYDETVTSTLAAVGVADTYIGKLEAMEAAGINTDEQAEQYHNTLALLCQVVPELADHINLETDMIDGGTEALRANTEAWKKNALQQAYQEQLTSLYGSYSSVLIEAEENSIGLTRAQGELETASQKQTDTMARMNRLYNDAVVEAEAWSKEYGGMTDVTGFLTQEYHDLENSLNDVNQEVWVAQESEKAYQKAIEDGSEATAEAEAQIALAEEAVNNLTAATDAGAQSVAEAAAQEEALQGAVSGVTEEMAALAVAYNESYAAAYESISGQYALWDEAAGVVATSASSINSALESQTAYWQDYNTNLQALTDRGSEIAGLSDVIASFADGSTDSVNAIAGMASASDEDLAAMVANWQALKKEQDTTAGSLAELETDFTNSMNNLQLELETTIGEMDLGAQAAESGKNTIQGFIDGAGEMRQPVEAAYARIAQAAMDAIDAQLQIHSPSKVMMEKAEMTWAGYIKQTEAMTPEVKEAMAGTAGAGTEAFSAEETQMVAIAPQLMAYLNAFQENNAVSAEQSASGGNWSPASAPPAIHIHFDIDGNVADSTVASLRQYGNEFAEAVLEVLENRETDQERRAYK